MNIHQLFSFQSDISAVVIPEAFNNPFDNPTSAIAQVAALEFQHFIASESEKWNYDFSSQKGKMFGVLVVQLKDKTYGFVGSISGKIPNNHFCEKLAPSVFDVSVDDYFINRGMTELTDIGNKIKETSDLKEISKLKARSRDKSVALQQQLFENYHFKNLSGVRKNVFEIFNDSLHGNPPVAAGECAAPKLLQFALDHDLKPIAIAEFWWGLSKKNKKHKGFYPACKDRCRPILEFMLEDKQLFNNRAL